MKGFQRFLSLGRIAVLAPALTVLAVGCGGESDSGPAVVQKSVEANRANTEAWQKAKSEYKVPKKAPRGR